MRRWFLRHPNVALVGLVILWAVTAHYAYEAFTERRWGFSAVYMAGAVFLGEDIRRWWRRT